MKNLNDIKTQISTTNKVNLIDRLVAKNLKGGGSACPPPFGNTVNGGD